MGISTPLTRLQMLEAMRRRDSRYDGVFYVGVSTTRIYCLPSCKARLPLARNVVFFFREEHAGESGYQPCRRCSPHRFPNAGPPWIEGCLEFMRRNSDRRVRDAELAELAGVETSTLRRTFAAVFEKTPAAYHREMRLLKAARSLGRNSTVLRVSEEAGFESLSGFIDAFRRQFGVSPGRYEHE